MAHLLKKAVKAACSTTLQVNVQVPPRCGSPCEPPSPDFSSLTPNEISILHQVIQRQDELEHEEAHRLWSIKQQLEFYEETVRLQSSGKGKLKHIDLRLCRLCFKTKFADGIGRLCYDCRKRVCLKCGSFTKSRWDRKKNKMTRSRWRCNMCEMKREFFCKTGVWYHGQRARPLLNRESFCEKTRSIDIESTEDEGHWHQSSQSDANVTDTDIPEFQSPSFQEIMHAKERRQSMPIFRTESAEFSGNDSENEENQHKFRRRRSHRRQSQRSVRHRKQATLYPEKSPSRSDRGSPLRSKPKTRYHDDLYPNYNDVSNHKTKRHIDFVDTRRYVKESHGGNIFLAIPGESDTDRHLIKRHNEGNIRTKDFHCLHSDNARDFTNTFSTTSSPEKIVIDSILPSSVTPQSERRRKIPTHDPNFLTPEGIDRVRSYSSDSNSSVRSVFSTLTDIENAEINQIPFTLDYISSLEPREILLYRDSEDESRRYSGLGMRVMCGKRGYGGKLGAFVTVVERGGPADSYGIKIGDQILLWNGKSLMGTTFEESKEIMNQTSDVVQLLVVRHPVGFSDDSPSISNPANVLKESNSVRNSPCPRESNVTPPTSLNLSRKRRLLPKTPVEIKKEERNVSGCVRISVSYSASCLTVTVIDAENLLPPDSSYDKPLNPMSLLHLLPNRGSYPPRQTLPRSNTSSPSWNETFEFHDMDMEELRKMSLEVTIWTVRDSQDVFLGEVLLDFADLEMDNEIISYHLQDHDENSSPLPVRKRKESTSDATNVSPMTSLNDASSMSTSPGIQASPRRDGIHGEIREKTSFSAIGLFGRERKSKITVAQSVPSSPQLSPISASENSFFNVENKGSASAQVRKHISNTMTKVSSLSTVDNRRSSLQDRLRNLNSRSQSFNDVLEGGIFHTMDNHSPMSRRSNSSTSGNLELGMPPHSLHTTDISTHFLDEDDSSEDAADSGLCTTSRRLGPDGDDITSLLGPGQVPPKPSSETSICGNIRLAFMVSKGQLEIDIINVTELSKLNHSSPPDTYVKAYLVGGSKVIQKKKTHIVKSSFSPFFRRKMKYSACNIHGRAIKVIVWARQGTFDKKQSLGEVVIKLDGLDLMHQPSSWYKLFPAGATVCASNESLNLW